MVEAPGVERFRLLTARKVMILGTATMAKEALLPDPLSVYCTKIFSRGSSVDATLRLSIRFARNGSRKKLSTVFRQTIILQSHAYPERGARLGVWREKTSRYGSTG